MAQQETDICSIGSGIVVVLFLKDATIWDYDHRLYSQTYYHVNHCWPVRIIARHICYPPSIFVKIIKPITYAYFDKRSRSRLLIHDVLESQVLDILSSYGIQKDMLPTEMGGTVLLDHAEWIASRRAVELKEI
jgi:hypothetical protein